MADDLDDFFDEIEEVEKDVVEEEQQEDNHHDDKAAKNEDEDDAPPTKKPKLETTTAPRPVRPKGMIVAASSSVVLHKQPQEDVHPPVGPSPPLHPPTSTTTDNHHHNHRHHPASSIPSSLPPLPTGPPPPPPPPLPPNNNNNNNNPTKRMAAGKVWVDPSLDEWPENDFRIFVGNLDPSTTDPQLLEHFSKKYTSIAKAKIVMDPTGTSKGYGFVSFLAPLDCAKSIREMDQTWLGSRPIRVKRSDWKDRNMNQVMKKNKKASKQRKRRGV